MHTPVFWRAHDMRKRAICEPLRPRTVDPTASLRNVLQTLHDNAVESTVCRRNGSRIARSRTLHARQQTGAVEPT
eukprot:2801934-Lingulodinium_polyedra.AAC.1